MLDSYKVNKTKKSSDFHKPLTQKDKYFIQKESRNTLHSLTEKNLLNKLNIYAQNLSKDYIDVLIVGGGPAGLMCAFQLKKINPNLKVLIVEAQKRAGLKLLASGGGRCNILNSGKIEDIIKSYYEHKNFVKKIFFIFSTNDLKTFFNNTGLPLREENNGRVFPKSNTAQSVLEYFLVNLDDLNVGLSTLTKVTEIKQINNLSAINYEVKVTKDENLNNESCLILKTKNIVLACGSSTYPHLSGSDTMKKISKKFNLDFINYTPALSHILLDKDSILSCSGSVFENISLKLKKDKKIIYQTSANFISTHRGISGPASQNLSHYLYKDEIWNKEKETIIYMDFIDEKIYQKFFNKDFLELLAKGKVDKKSEKLNLNLCIKENFSISQKKAINKLINNLFYISTKKEKDYAYLAFKDYSKKELSELLHLIKNGLPLKPLQQGNMLGRPSINQAKVGSGGLSLNELNPHSLELKKYKNFFVCGEAIDINGETGGYNLQMAFITASVIARHISQL